jgi:hypothetical protein
MIFQDYMAKEEIMTILLLKGRQEEKTFTKHLKRFVATKDMPLNKLSLITKSMIGSKNRFDTAQ